MMDICILTDTMENGSEVVIDVLPIFGVNSTRNIHIWIKFDTALSGLYSNVDVFGGVDTKNWQDVNDNFRPIFHRIRKDTYIHHDTYKYNNGRSLIHLRWI